MKCLARLRYWAAICFAVAAFPATADDHFEQAKDIVERTLGGQVTGNDAVKLSFVVLNRDGSTQMERAAHFPFYSGELIRVKVVSSQNGTLQLTNISPSGKITPFRTIQVQAGLAAYYPPEPGGVLEFTNSVGTEILRVNFTPTQPMAANPPAQPGAPAGQPQFPPSYGGSPQNSGPPPAIPATPSSATPSRASEFFSGVQGKSYLYAKDIRETVLEVPQATYLTRPSGSGPLQYEVSIQHRNQ